MFGFDYGIKPTIMIVGDIEFNEFIVKGEMRGLGYISIPKNALENTPLKVVLLFENEMYGKKTMRCFNKWIEGSNGNGEALGLDIIEHKDGGYVLCLYQDIDCLIKRNVPDYLLEWVTPIYTGITYFKEIDNVSENYINMKKALKFTQCHISGGTFKKQFIELPEIVKSKINIYSEDAIPKNSHLQSYNRKESLNLAHNKEQFNSEINKDIEEKREKNIKYFYPITYNKVIKQGFINNIISELENNYDKVIILQAICNITLYDRLKQEEKLQILNQNCYMNILQYLLDNYESIESYYPDESEFTKEKIIEQIEKDKEAITQK